MKILSTASESSPTDDPPDAAPKTGLSLAGLRDSIGRLTSSIKNDTLCAWVRVVREKRSELSSAGRLVVEQAFREVLREPMTPFPRLMDSARQVEKLQFYDRHRGARAIVLRLIPVVAELHPTAVAAARPQLRSLTEQQSDLATWFTAALEALTSAGHDRHAAAAAILDCAMRAAHGAATPAQTTNVVGAEQPASSRAASTHATGTSPAASVGLSPTWPEFMKRLRELSPSDIAWDEATQFAEELRRLAEEKLTQRARMAADAAAHEHRLNTWRNAWAGVEGFETELAYLGATLPAISPELAVATNLDPGVITTLGRTLAELRDARALPTHTASEDEARHGAIVISKRACLETLETLRAGSAQALAGVVDEDGLEGGAGALDLVQHAATATSASWMSSEPEQELTAEPSALNAPAADVHVHQEEPPPPQQGATTSSPREVAVGGETAQNFTAPANHATRLPDPLPPDASDDERENRPHERSTAAGYDLDSQPERANREAIGEPPVPSASSHEPAPRSALLHGGRAPDGREHTGVVPSTILWRALAEGDIAGAYWLAVSSAYSASASSTPQSELIAALQASEWVSHSNSSLVAVLAQSVERVSLASDESHALALSAALNAALFHRESHLRGWLQIQGPLASPLRRVVAALADFANVGHALSPSLVSALRSDAERGQALEEARAAVRHWLSASPARTTRFARASRVWKEHLQKDLADTLRECLEGGDRASTAATKLALIGTATETDRRIEKADAAIRAGGAPAIAFGAREQLFALVQEAVSCGTNLVQLTHTSLSKDWLLGRARTLQGTVRDEAPQAFAELAKLAEADDPLISCPARLLARSLANLLTQLQISPSTFLAIPEWPGRKEFQLLTPAVSNLQEGLSARLLWYPTLDGELSGALSAHQCAQVQTELTKPLPDLREAFGIWLANCRFDKARLLLPLFQEDASVESAFEQGFARERHRLTRDIEEAVSSVEKAVVDGYASPSQRAELAAQLNGIESSNATNFRAARHELEAVTNRLSSLRSEHLRRTVTRRDALKARLRTTDSEVANVDDRFGSIDDAIKNEDIRAADEALFQLENGTGVRAESTTQVPSETSPQQRLQSFRQFSAEYHREVNLDRQGLAGLLRRFDGIRFDEITLPVGQKRDPIKEALRSWQRLKMKDQPEHQLRPLLQYLGFNLGTGSSSMTKERNGPYWQAYRIEMHDGGKSPVPQFGSSCRGMYRLLCVWERPGADSLSGIFHEIPREPTLVFYLGRLNEQQRVNLKNGARQKDLVLLCIDETLLFFVAGERDLRLPAVFDIALPYTYLNPYTPFQAGDVPPEMYFGRRDAASKLRDPAGPCIVYGGRQLGKSALLRKVQREFNDHARRQFASVIDIKLLGDPRAGVDTKSLWTLVREELQRLQLLSATRASDDPVKICEQVREICSDANNTRILLLLDEADSFLDADSKDNFPITDKLRELMASTGRRFKVVLAGLHNVQRFQSLPNQPLAHFGQAVQVGPLDPQDAMALIVRPFATLGFAFEKEHDVLRILSYTNYHPGLIQLFCHELMRRLQLQMQQSVPPTTIRREAIESVYINQQVREGIRERFDWTLALDPRYQAIAWSLILHQQESGNHLVPKPPSEVLQIARVWWSRGFQSGIDEFRGILDEMCGLGILVRGHLGYSLRSPNVVRLIGDVESRLLELSHAEPPPAFDAAQLHRPFSAEGEYSPLKFDDERRLLAGDSGLALVFGSAAMGLDRVPQALDTLAHAQLGSHGTQFLSVPDTAVTGDLTAWLRSNVNRVTNGSDSRIVVVAKANTSPSVVASTLLSAISGFQRTPGHWLRGVVIVPADGLAEWFQYSQRTRLEDESALVVLRRWTEVGLRARLDHAGLMGDTANLMEVTGGWDFLVSEALRSAKGSDLRPGIDFLRKELEVSESRTRQRFLSGLGLSRTTETIVTSLLDYSKNGELRFDVMVDLAELLQSDHPWLGADQLHSALLQLELLGVLRRGAAQFQIDPVVANALRTTSSR